LPPCRADPCGTRARLEAGRGIDDIRDMLKDPLDDLIDAAAPALGIAVAPDWKPAVRAHLAVTLQHADRVAGFSLPDDAEPAPVFIP